ncbi:TfoX/Sxy family DNA transformation protein [Mixta tenebrionis]|uniref:TfoX/Sxy family DNA transformation protein n=1 Tax=Mixta tenebrionis TaxID=2562439 RepID=A0A506VGI9_9GAMM|nr:MULTISPECIES: TfoX/Sxy family DNA transformation protein [Mixta]QHM75998.1 DNA transformation protein TfoX1 [Mixta theicola]TPW44526.1 TfoX/Sxy family DNA transformation protein [Mixta tenebrionis]
MDTQQRIAQSKAQLAALGNITVRSQFGGYSLAVEKVVFALITNGELYLRGSETLNSYLSKQCLPPLVINKKGLPVILHYYRINEELWADRSLLIKLSKSALALARQQKNARRHTMRVKDLPNMGVRMETLLREIGINSVHALREAGAKDCWLRLRARNQHLGLNCLLALQGAISGHHQAALPAEVKEELRHWFYYTVNAGKGRHR